MLIRSEKAAEAEIEYKEVSVSVLELKFMYCKNSSVIVNDWSWFGYVLTQLKAESEEATQRYEAIVKLMNEEIVRFQEQKTADMGLAFHEFAKGQERLAKDIADAWRSLLPKLEACTPSW